ncbi:hypothetical protein PV325_009467 [Microctonus aethiopoides]|nr:hypothetical protein PV325_009467 [Microctonus aethiopoides]
MDIERHFQRPDIIENVQNKNGRLKKNLRSLLSRLAVDPEKDRQLQHVLQQPGVNILDRFKISRELFISWSEDIEKLFPSESKFLHYSPYKSVREEVRGADGTVVFKKRKINTSGALYEHCGYLKTKLRQQHLLEEARLVEVVPEVLRFTGEEQDAVEWLATHLDPADTVKQKWRKAYPARMLRLRELD